MATATKQTAAKKSTTAKKPAAKKSTTSTAKKPAAKKATKAAPKRTPLLEREPRVVIEDAGYAVTGVIGDVIDLAKDLPTRAESAWKNVNDAAKDAPKRAKTLRSETPTKVESQLTELRTRVSKDADRLVASFEKRFDAKAKEGRKVAERVRKDERVATILDRTSTSRSQVKAAVTSATKTADVAVEAGKKQIDVARSQAKGAVTAASKAPEAAVEASREQAGNTRTQTKAAATSVRKSADEITDAVT